MKDIKNIKTNVFFVTAVAVLCTLLWGTAFPAIKTGYVLFSIDSSDIPSKLIFAGARFFLAGIIVLIIGIITEKDKRSLLPGKKDIAPIALLGFFQTFMQYLLLYIGITYITGTKSSVLTSVSTFGSIIMSAIFFRSDKLGLRKIAGCAVGITGIIVMNFGDGLSGFTLIGDGLVILSNLSGAAGNIVSKKVTENRSAAKAAGWQLTFGGGALIALGSILGGRLSFQSTASVLILLYLAAMAGVAFMLWTMLLRNNPVSRVSMFNLLIPVFGTMWSGLFLGENIFTLTNAASLLLVCSGIFLVNLTTDKKSAKKK